MTKNLVELNVENKDAIHHPRIGKSITEEKDGDEVFLFHWLCGGIPSC